MRAAREDGHMGMSRRTARRREDRARRSRARGGTGSINKRVVGSEWVDRLTSAIVLVVSVCALADALAL